MVVLDVIKALFADIQFSAIPLGDMYLQTFNENRAFDEPILNKN